MNLNRVSFMSGLAAAGGLVATRGNANALLTRPRFDSLLQVMNKPPIRLYSPAPIIRPQTQWPPRLADGSTHPMTISPQCGRNLVVQRGVHPDCGSGDSGVKETVRNTSSVNYASSSSQAIYNGGALSHSVRWTQPVNRVTSLEYDGPSKSTILQVLNAAVLQAHNNYIWIENVNIAIAVNQFSVSWGSGNSIFGDGSAGGGINLSYTTNSGSMSWVLLPPGTPWAHCLAWQLIYTAALVATIAAGAIIVAPFCALPIVDGVTCFVAGALVSALGAEVMGVVNTARTNACAGMFG